MHVQESRHFYIIGIGGKVLIIFHLKFPRLWRNSSAHFYYEPITKLK